MAGQDGQLLSRHLIAEGYDVVGTTRGESREVPLGNCKVPLRHCDYERSSIEELLEAEIPDEVYNLAGQAYVGKSWLKVEETLQSVALIAARFLESILAVNPKIRFFQASTSQIYAPSDEVLTEESRFGPNTPYGCSKMYAHFLVQSFRDTQGLFAVNGILFNHESPLRKDDFFLQKVVLGAVAISRGELDELDLGNLEIYRDMGCADEFMKAAQLTLQADEPGDYNICTGVAMNLGELVAHVFSKLGLDPDKYVRTNRNLIRRYEPPLIVGSHEAITRATGWVPKRGIRGVLDEMLEVALEKAG